MHAWELALPEAAAAAAVVPVSKLMGSEGLAAGGSGGVGKIGTGQSAANNIALRPSFEGCSQRDKTPANSVSEPTLWNKTSDAGYFVSNNQASRFHYADPSDDFNLGNKNDSPPLATGVWAKQLHRRAGKVARSNNGGSKRSRSEQMGVSMNESGVEDTKGNSTGLGSSPPNYVPAEKTQMSRQKNNGNGKQADKRNGRVPKSRSDTFSLKNGLVSFSSVTGGGNFLVYGSKSSNVDVTKDVDELSLNELLDGTYNCPSLIKDKGKGAQNSNANLLNSVRKACTVLQLRSPVHDHQSLQIDNNYNHKVSKGPITIIASPASRTDGGKGDYCTKNQPSADKESCGEKKTVSTVVDSPLYPPKDILDKLSLATSKDLDSLLLDAVKPASSSRNNTDLRLGKTVSHRTGLPPFPWSHNSSGHSKSGPDTAKLSANRITCQGKWVKMENKLSSLKDSCGFLVHLESLSYDHRLVPMGNQESGPSEKRNASSTCEDLTSNERVSSSSAACSASQVPLDEHSPEILAAAKTLCEMATQSSKQNRHGVMKWLKKPSQKSMNACKLKLNEKSERLYGASAKPSMSPENLVKVADGMLPSKKLRLSVDGKTDDVCCTNTATKGPINWSAPRSIRSSPSKLFRDSVPETKNCHTNVVKKSYMMPPPARVMDKGCSSQPKLK